MKILKRYGASAFETELIAAFGQAQLVRYLDGTCELLGGSDADRSEAKDWISMFIHSVILRGRLGGRIEMRSRLANGFPD